MDLKSILQVLLGLPGDELKQTEKVIEPYRYIPFEPRLPSTLAPELSEPMRPGRFIPGTFDRLTEEAGYASDDPYQIGAKLEAWKDYKRLKDKSSR
jgi:hypothetical protein